MSVKKVEEVIARDLAEALRTLLPALAQTQVIDTNGNQGITVGAGTAGTQSAYICVRGEASTAIDSLGLASRVYQPHVLQLVVETSTIANVSLLTMANLSLLMAICAKFGTKLEIYMTANLTAPAFAGITGAPAQTIWSDVYNKMKNAV
jgi:hypothetical protein